VAVDHVTVKQRRSPISCQRAPQAHTSSAGLRQCAWAGGWVCDRSVCASKAVVIASICSGVRLNCGIFSEGPKAPGCALSQLRSREACVRHFHEQQLREWLAADAAQLRRKVFRFLDAIDLVTTGTAILHHQLLAVLNLRGSGRSRCTLATRSVPSSTPGSQPVWPLEWHQNGNAASSCPDRNGWIGHPVLQPFRFCLGADARELRSDVPPTRIPAAFCMA